MVNHISQWVIARLLLCVDTTRYYQRTFFDRMMRIVPSIAVEAVALRWNAQGEAEIFLTQRAADESYAGLWHTPGSLLRNGETSDDVFARLEEREFQVLIASKTFVADVYWAEPRGWIDSRVYVVELAEDPTTLQTSKYRGKWFPVDALPEHTIPEHTTRILPVAIEHFCKKSHDTHLSSS